MPTWQLSVPSISVPRWNLNIKFDWVWYKWNLWTKARRLQKVAKKIKADNDNFFNNQEVIKVDGCRYACNGYYEKVKEKGCCSGEPKNLDRNIWKMRLDDDYTKIGIKIFFEDNAWKIANENNQPKGLNQDGKKKLKRQHSQSFLQFDVPPHKSSKSKRQELPSKLFWEVINNEKFQITKLTEEYHGVVYEDLMGLKELEAKKATNCDPLSLCGLSLCKTCETNLIEIKA